MMSAKMFCSIHFIIGFLVNMIYSSFGKSIAKYFYSVNKMKASVYTAKLNLKIQFFRIIIFCTFSYHNYFWNLNHLKLTCLIFSFILERAMIMLDAFYISLYIFFWGGRGQIHAKLKSLLCKFL